MKKLPILTAVVCLVGLLAVRGVQAWQQAAQQETPAAAAAQSQPPAPQADPEASQLIDRARQRLLERQSVQADLIQRIVLGDYRLESTGRYASATGMKYRSSFDVELGNYRGRFLEVSDGQVLHTTREVVENTGGSASTAIPEVDYARRDLQKILQFLRDNPETLDIPDTTLAAQFGMGGLPAILASLERTMVFESVRSETLDGRDYFVVQGRWNMERRTELLSGLGNFASQIIGFLPDIVRVYLNRETLFPERFLYLVRVDAQATSFRPMLAIEFRDIQLDQPIGQQQFNYLPPAGVEERDETSMYLELIQQSFEANEAPDAATDSAEDAAAETPATP